MNLFNMYRAGVNVGGWLSQYTMNDADHYKTFITEEDIKIISEWGADHIRLPVDYDLIQEDTAPYGEREEGLTYIDHCLEWCKKQRLNVILDLHKAPGQVYGDNKTPNPLLVEEGYKKRFLKIWAMFAKRYKNIGDSLAFELLNEITDSTGYLWNRLYSDAVNVIRQEDKGRMIIIGSNDANSIFTLKELNLLDDPGIAYNFHYYDPLIFTHQRAHFSEDMLAYDKEIQYPGEIPGLAEFLCEKPEYAERLGRYAWEKNDRKLMEKYLLYAENFKKYTGEQLYCGEFGVINNAPQESAIRWVRDFVELLDSYEIGRAYWSYKEMDFGLVDKERNVINPGLLKQLF